MVEDGGERGGDEKCAAVALKLVGEDGIAPCVR